MSIKKGIVILIITALGCGKTAENNTAYVDQPIVIFNAGNEDKASIARMLSKINKCGPKVVGINFLFENSLQRADTILANTIKEAQNVVLTSINQDDTYFRSDTLFRQVAAGEGLVELGIDEHGDVTKQMIFVSVADELKWSFPMTVVSFYNADKSVVTMHNAIADKYYAINFESGNNFTILEEGDSTWDCSTIKDKIVLIGFLGPGSKDTYLITGGERKYATWILANCVGDILNGHFVRVD